MRYQKWFAAGLSLIALTSPAAALVMVVGTGLAHDCFVEAKIGRDPQGTVALCTRALREEALLAKDRAGTYVNRGVMEMALGHVDDAMADYNTSLSTSPDLGDAYVDRGAALINLKRYDDALADINKGIALGPSYPEVGYFNRAVAEQITGNFKDAYYDYKHALEIEPGFTLASERLKDFTVIRKPASGG